MLKPALKRLVLALLSAVLFITQVTPLYRQTEAQPADGWVDGDYPTLEIGGAVDKIPKECYFAEHPVFVYKNLDGSHSDAPNTYDTGMCSVATPAGIFGSTSITPDSGVVRPYSYGYVSTGGAGYRVEGGGVIPIPNQHNFMATDLYGHPPRGAWHVRFVDDLRQFGSFERGFVQYGAWEEIVYKMSLHPNQQLRDSAGNALTFYKRHFAFSPNGEWMIAEIYKTGFVRINTRTQDITLIDASFRPSYHMGMWSSTNLAISNDGLSAMASVVNSTQTSSHVTAYDLRGCSYSGPIVHVSSGTETGCRKRSLSASIRAQLIGANYLDLSRFTIADNMRFIGGQQVRGFMHTSQEVDGVVRKEKRAVTLNVAGYQPPEQRYLALGDSFSSGEGAPGFANSTYPNGYIAGTDSLNPRNRCHVSPVSYPYLAAQTLGIDDFISVACSGAKYSEHFLSRAQYDTGSLLPGAKSQSEFTRIYAPVKTVTLTMFGNDIGFSGKIRNCLALGENCYHFREQREGVAQEIRDRFDQMVNMYKSVRQDSGEANVYVLGYPKLFATDPNTPCSLNTPFSTEEREFAASLAGYLNATIKAAAEKAGVVYIDVENAFSGHELCSGADDAQIAVNGLSGRVDIPGGPDDLITLVSSSFHPNQLGHQLMANTLISQSWGFTRDMPEPDLSAKPPTSGVAYNNLVASAPTGGNSFKRIVNFVSGYDNIYHLIRKHHSSRATINELISGQSYEVWLYSTPTKIGTATVNPDGSLQLDITIPDSVEPGLHTVHIFAKDMGGRDVDIQKQVYVIASEDDFDGDGIPNSQEKCWLVEPANVDADHDGIDDACDPQILNTTPVDTTAPVVTGVVDTQANQRGWHNQETTITWTSTDDSGSATIPAPTAVSLEGEHTYTSEPSCDDSGNCATGSLTLKLDTTAPSIDFSSSSQPDETGWYTTAPTITFSCTDPLADPNDPASASGVQDCPEPITVDTDTDQPLTVTAQDFAGNIATVTIPLQVDATPPDINFTTDRTPNAAGWFNGPVRLSFDCQDAASGIADCSQPVTISQDGGHIVTGTATDNAGNQRSVNVFVLIDSTLPDISYEFDSPANQHGWHNQDVTVSFTCTDEGSGVADCSQPATVGTETDGHAVTGTVTDNADNSASITTDPIRIDKTAPVVADLALSTNTKTTDQTAYLTFSATDALSGVQRVEYFVGEDDPGVGNGAAVDISSGAENGRVELGADYPIGVYQLSVRAQDFAGNWSDAYSSEYLVVYSSDMISAYGYHFMEPSLENGDALPGLDANTRSGLLVLGMNIGYAADGSLSPNSDFQLGYAARTNDCGYSWANGGLVYRACPSYQLDADTIHWMVGSSDANHTVQFLASATQTINGQEGQPVQVLVTATDAARRPAQFYDSIDVRVFPAGADVFQDEPLYRVSDGAMWRGAIRIVDQTNAAGASQPWWWSVITFLIRRLLLL